MKRVLVVDDEEDIAESLRMILEEEGYEACVCSSGPACLERVRKEPPALLVLDVMMPEMSGLEVLRALRRDPLTRNLPVILTSAVVPRASQEELGWQVFLHKPFALEALLSAVGELLTGSGAADEPAGRPRAS